MQLFQQNKCKTRLNYKYDRKTVETFKTNLRKGILRKPHLSVLACMRVDLNDLFINTGTCQ